MLDFQYYLVRINLFTLNISKLKLQTKLQTKLQSIINTVSKEKSYYIFLFSLSIIMVYIPVAH